MSKPTPEQLDQIALQLFGKKLRDKWTVPRCPARDIKKMLDFELEGNFEHSAPKHVCGDCQCSNHAGADTRGEFWGQGEEWDKVGHYGVGYCKTHEELLISKGQSKMMVLDHAENHRAAIANRGLGAHKDPHIIAYEEAKVAERHLALVKNMEHIGDLMGELMKHLDQSKKKDTEIITKALESLEERINDYDLEDEDGRKVMLKELKEIVMVASNLTEPAGGRIIPMTDKTKLELAMKLANNFSKLNLDEYRMGRDSYVHVDEVVLRIPKMLKQCSVIFTKVHELHLNHDQETGSFKEELDRLEDDWVQSIADIWATMKTGTR